MSGYGNCFGGISDDTRDGFWLEPITLSCSWVFEQLRRMTGDVCEFTVFDNCFAIPNSPFAPIMYRPGTRLNTEKALRKEPERTRLVERFDAVGSPSKYAEPIKIEEEEDYPAFTQPLPGDSTTVCPPNSPRSSAGGPTDSGEFLQTSWLTCAIDCPERR